MSNFEFSNEEYHPFYNENRKYTLFNHENYNNDFLKDDEICSNYVKRINKNNYDISNINSNNNVIKNHNINEDNINIYTIHSFNFSLIAYIDCNDIKSIKNNALNILLSSEDYSNNRHLLVSDRTSYIDTILKQKKLIELLSWQINELKNEKEEMRKTHEIIYDQLNIKYMKDSSEKKVKIEEMKKIIDKIKIIRGDLYDEIKNNNEKDFVYNEISNNIHKELIIVKKNLNEMTKMNLVLLRIFDVVESFFRNLKYLIIEDNPCNIILGTNLNRLNYDSENIDSFKYFLHSKFLKCKKS